MTTYLGIIIGAALVNNVFLVQLLGVSSLFLSSNKLQNALELALLNFVVLFLAASINLAIFRLILNPLGLEFLRIICFVAVSSTLTILILESLKKKFPLSLRRQRLAFYLTSGNSAILGVSIINADSVLSLTHGVAYNFGAALGFALMIISFAALRLRLDTADIPTPFRGAAIQLISAGIVSMCLLGFAGLV
ncbi:MAG: electron transport complex subunit RsxA [Gammaproteobacteria bacterium]|nr:electron transport complex subunit RsxA [Gammaproteobacteria bacterium]MBT3859558.1 electron transport complex subunit RsxA [Gammaproteobacteria bacterium]MBT3986548.1 electron transport complex subunit RsxA [Gammaproteobacteria bacterium]MBT4255887.1 electron transport complex subunit RsxA [Gammaproteobacteria bacterium]MBT4581108.1 electron transport complex subunit RsxA [Gammaproteobacteria bacterium]